MPSDTLQKLDYLTMHLRGFDRRGAAAAFHSARATGFTLSGRQLGEWSARSLLQSPVKLFLLCHDVTAHEGPVGPRRRLPQL